MENIRDISVNASWDGEQDHAFNVQMTLKVTEPWK